jgi:ketosteroid isomerase-like protein
MSQENVEVVKRWVDALNAGDEASFLDTWDDECEFLTVTGSQIDGTPYSGREGLRRYWEERMQTWTELRFDAERVLEGNNDDVVVAIGHFLVKGRGSGVLVEQRIGVVYRLRGQKIRYCRSYLDPKDALQAVGLSEHDAHADS